LVGENGRDVCRGGTTAKGELKKGVREGITVERVKGKALERVRHGSRRKRIE